MHKVNNINLQTGGGDGGHGGHVDTNKTTRINPNERPTVTYTDTLQTMDKMAEKLKGYERVDDIDTVDIGTPVRYITWKRNDATGSGRMKFCIGGILIAKYPNQCQLSNFRRDIKWNVKKQHNKSAHNKNDIFKTIFFKKCNGSNNTQQGGGEEVDEGPQFTTIQAREIDKFYRQKRQQRKRQQWLEENIYNKLTTKFF